MTVLGYLTQHLPRQRGHKLRPGAFRSLLRCKRFQRLRAVGWVASWLSGNSPRPDIENPKFSSCGTVTFKIHLHLSEGLKVSEKCKADILSVCSNDTHVSYIFCRNDFATLPSARLSKTRFSAKHMNQASECLSFAFHSKMFNNSHTLGETLSTFDVFTSLAPSAHLLGQCCGRATNSLSLWFYTKRKLWRSVLSSKASWIKHTSTLEYAETIVSPCLWVRSKLPKVEPFTSFCIDFVISFWSFCRQMAPWITQRCRRLRLMNRMGRHLHFNAMGICIYAVDNICRHLPFSIKYSNGLLQRQRLVYQYSPVQR